MTDQPNHSEKVRARFMAKVGFDPVTGCWPWQGHVNKRWGYGQFWDGEHVRGAHQVSYELFKGPIPEGTEPDHLCRVRCCVHPDHLEAVTRQVNLLRGDTIPARKAAQTHCINGHPFDDDNTYRAKNGTRGCRICKAERNRAWVAANRDRRRELDRECYARRRGK